MGFICFLDNSPMSKQVKLNLLGLWFVITFIFFMDYLMGYFSPLNMNLIL